MQIKATTLAGVFIITPLVFNDERGFFLESYHYKKFQKLGIPVKFVQDNHSRSIQNTLRGLHYQKGKSAQSKLVRCIAGEIFDVAVDLRKKSPTFGQWFGCILSAENKQQLFVPKGFAHGFSVLSPTAEVTYKCDAYYDQQAEAGIIWNDPELNIDWKIKDAFVSGKDTKLPNLKDIKRKDLF